MKGFRNFRQGVGYQLRESFRVLWSHRLANTGAVLLLIFCLLVTGAFALLMLNLNRLADEIGAVNEVRVYVEETAPPEAAAAVGDELLKLDNVREIRFVSKEEALESLRGDFGDLLDGLEDDNPLRDGYRVELADQARMKETVDAVSAIPNVAKVSYNAEVAERFVEVRNVLGLAGLGVGVVLALVSVFIVYNSIRIAASTKRSEIEIMKTVGATNAFVRTPFLIEGLILGIFGAAAAYGLAALGYLKLFLPAAGRLAFVSAVPFDAVAVPLAAVYAAVGVLMGLLGSSIAINRYLKH